MRIRNPWLIKSAGFVLARLLRSWLGGLRYRLQVIGPTVLPWQGTSDRFIYVTWHEYLLLPLYLASDADVCMLLSRHSDGQLLSTTLRHFGIEQICGSEGRGGVEALRSLIRVSERKHIALIPDGPRGPRRRVKLGLIYLAARSGLPVVPAGFGLRRPWRLKSWDRFALPRPWSRAAYVVGPPIFVPQNASKFALEHYRKVVQDCLDANTRTAESWAETGVFEPPNPTFDSIHVETKLRRVPDMRESRAAA
jgi:lysophospholipid acyltransferase (LPLAT)-like uncharacterized protein